MSIMLIEIASQGIGSFGFQSGGQIEDRLGKIVEANDMDAVRCRLLT